MDENLFLLAIVSGFEGPTNTLERAHPQAAELAPLLPSDCVTHARPLLPAALASVSYGFVFVRVRVPTFKIVPL